MEEFSKALISPDFNCARILQFQKHAQYEMRTSLVPVLGFTSVLKEQFNSLTRSDIISMIDNIENCATSLYHKMEKFYNYSEINSLYNDKHGRKDLKERKILTKSTVISEYLHEEFKRKNRHDDLHLDIEDINLIIPEKYLKIVLKEITHNCLKNSNDKERIKIKGYSLKKNFHLEIKDYSCNLTQEKIDNADAFNFFKSDSYSINEGVMQLEMVKRICEIFDCKFQVEKTEDLTGTIKLSFLTD